MKQIIAKNVIDEILQHREIMDLDIVTIAKTYEIKKEDFSKRNLSRILIPAIHYRAGPQLDSENSKKILKKFDKSYDEIREILKKGNSEEDMNLLVELIDNFPMIGPKITGVYLKDVIYNFKIGKQLIPYLYLPIDRHINNIFVDRLKIIDKEDMPNASDKFTTKKNKIFQFELSQIHTPRVEFDFLWYVGSRFCSKKLFCDICWIKNYCKNKVL